ncbi:hypothetical protein B0H13DRAFT_1876242 [Mycena leptocephala]|nr:hypothetical protein B0H13DRAFT_1876242 [Mycena leptocephala]
MSDSSLLGKLASLSHFRAQRGQLASWDLSGCNSVENPLQPTLPTPFPSRTQSAHAHHPLLLSWFLDAPAAPFGLHLMPFVGKATGKDVGIMLVDAFPACGLDVSIVTDGTQSLCRFTLVHLHILILCRLRLLSHGYAASSPVLLLLGIRLGLDDVNPIYYETIKRLYTFPQSVGIAGGRPSPSYYFVRVQGDGLFDLEPPSFEARGDAATIFGRAAIINTAVAVGVIARTQTLDTLARLRARARTPLAELRGGVRAREAIKSRVWARARAWAEFRAWGR